MWYEFRECVWRSLCLLTMSRVRPQYNIPTQSESLKASSRHHIVGDAKFHAFKCWSLGIWCWDVMVRSSTYDEAKLGHEHKHEHEHGLISMDLKGYI